MRRSLVLMMSLAFIGLGCAAQPILAPAPEATRPTGQRDVGVVDVAGVRLWASGEPWRGVPSTLPRLLTPVRVTVQNHSGHPVRVAYRDFSLLGERGFRYSALPPFSLQGQAIGQAGAPGAIVPAAYHPRTVVRPRFSSERFWVASPYLGFYPGFHAWPYGWEVDPFYDRWYGSWPTPLPSQDMLEQALPEGVIEDGGQVSGFVYFQRTSDEDRVRLQFDVQDARSGEALGTGSVPFVVLR